MRGVVLLLATVCLIATAQPAFAYIGPGAGITMLGALWGIVVAIALAIGAVVVYPIRVLLRRRRKPLDPATSTARETVVETNPR